MLLQEWARFWANYFVTALLNDRRVDEVCQEFMLRTRTRFTSKQPHIFPQEQSQPRCVLLSCCQLIQNDLIKMCARWRAPLADELKSKWQICECLHLSCNFSQMVATLTHCGPFGGNFWCIIICIPHWLCTFICFKQTKPPASVNGDSWRSFRGQN